jgi:FkbM family methyltransferase
MNRLLELRKKFQNHTLSKADYIKRAHEVHRLLFEYPEFMKQTDIAGIEINDDGVIFTTRKRGLKYCGDPLDRRIIPIEILNLCGYEERELELMLELLEPCNTIVDMGANVGWFVMNAARVYPDKTLHAFEPVPKTFEYLRRNLALNRIDGVKVYNLAVGEKDQNITLYYYPECSANASARNVSGTTHARKIPCRAVSLDSFAREHGLVVDFIKCDIEGAELFAFKGARGVLERDRPMVFSEILRKWSAGFGYHPNDLLDFFAGLGYYCYVIAGRGLRRFHKVTDDTAETNYIFLHAEKHADLIARAPE